MGKTWLNKWSFGVLPFLERKGTLNHEVRIPQFHLPRDAVRVHVRTKATIHFLWAGALTPCSLETRSPPEIARYVGWLTQFGVGLHGLACSNESTFHTRKLAYCPRNLFSRFYLFI